MESDERVLSPLSLLCVCVFSGGTSLCGRNDPLMLDLQKYICFGAALRDALDRYAERNLPWSRQIETVRKTRLTYSDCKETSLSV